MLNKKIMLGVVALGLSTAAISTYAATSGVYVGGQLGYGNVHQGNDVDGARITTYHLTDRILGGYQFNEYVATELGWSRFGNVDAKSAIGNLTLRTNVVDLAVKGILPVADKVSVYGKLGAAYVMENVSGHFYGYHEDETNKKLLPEAGVGVSYAFTDNVSADVSYTRIQAIGSTNTRQIHSLDFAGVGVTYSFG